MYDILEFEIHLDRTVFTVNDIITGLIRIIQAKKQIPGLSLALRASERLISLGMSLNCSLMQTQMIGGAEAQPHTSHNILRL